MRDLLHALHARFIGRVAIVSGRSIAQIDAILGPVAQLLALSGSHGGEWRIDGETFLPERPHALIDATRAMREFAIAQPRILLEEKSLGTAFHFRSAPDLAAEALRFTRALAGQFGLFLQQGKMMVELRPAGHDKGSALRGLMQFAPLAGAEPVFAGDDVTDEDGFAAAQELGGYGVLVGDPRPTLARYRLSGTAAVREWLADLAL